ncbi:Terminase small subunit [Seinonella peptonophila]|uniref:Terminase small subunit n=1 Tax=Seinonella peptonophila TaxID=112248 RepID=A0A1M5B4H7_9BACL|nr:terminase small subunit [Seinonella peptonophila]SHF37355.1 Terminase small subunit [Seinonella peptonophila]
MKLNPKLQAFADYYIELGNAEKAAIKARKEDFKMLYSWLEGNNDALALKADRKQ